MNENKTLRKELTSAGTWVIKVGSSLIADTDHSLNHSRIASWATQISAIQQAGYQIVLVSSGAVAEGVRRLNWQTRPDNLHQIQAAAAVGQVGLIHAYETEFARHHLSIAQVLLTHSDLSDRLRYLNARTTLRGLLKLNVIPVVNENDALATEEIQFGDNDTLAAMVANLIDANVLLILTDQQGLYDKNPSQTKEAQLIVEAEVDSRQLDDAAGPSAGAMGRGGMITKVLAARQAAGSGTTTIIADGRNPEIIARIVQGEPLGTRLKVNNVPLAARKLWISGLKATGSLVLDDGAGAALTKGGNSLLPVGLLEVRGQFKRGDMVECYRQDGTLIAKGLINYSADEAQQIMGKHSQEVATLMGNAYEQEVIHCDNMALIE